MSGATSTIALGAMAAGTVTSAYGAYNTSKGNKAAGEYNAAVARNNALLAEWKAQDAIVNGQKREQAQRMKTAQLKGTQRATLAARGIDLTEGSALNILTDTDFMGERDALQVRDNAAKEAWAYRNEALGYGTEASMYQSRADAESPGLAAGMTLLTGASAVADRWYTNKRSGMKGY